MTAARPEDFDQADATLPGLEPPARGESAIVTATRRTIADLARLGLATEQHAMLTRLLLDLAEVVDAGRRQGRASAVAMAAAQMLATYAILVPAEDNEGGGQRDAFDELAADLRRAAALGDPSGQVAQD